MHTLVKSLRRKNPRLFYEFEQVRKKAEGGVLDYQTIYGDTINGLSHVKDVEKKLDLLIPQYIKASLNDFEVYVLLSAVYLHDLGKIRRNYYLHHSTISQEIISAYHSMLGIDNEHVATVIGWVAYGHGNDGIKILPEEFSVSNYGSARVQFLAALLRLADELSITYERAPKILTYITDGIKEKEKWDVRQSVSNVEVEPAKWMIKVFALTESEHTTHQLMNLEKYVQHRLEEIRPYLLRNGIYYSKTDFKIERRDARKNDVITAETLAETYFSTVDKDFLCHVRQELGVQKIQKHRSSFPFDDIGKLLDCKKKIKEVDLSGKALAGLFRSHTARKNLKELIRNGSKVRVLILSNNIKLPQVNEIDKLIAEDQKGKIGEVLGYLKALKTETVKFEGTLQYKFTEKIMYTSVNRADDEMMVTHYLGSLEGNLCPTLWIKGESTSLFEIYKQEFDEMWRDGYYPENFLELDKNIIAHLNHAIDIKQTLADYADCSRIPPPLMAIIFITMKCEEDCANCTYRDERDEGSMKFELLKKVIDELIELGVKTFEFSGGGEPLLYGGFPVLLERIATIKPNFKDINFGLLTNGLHIDILDEIDLERLTANFSYVRFTYAEATELDKAKRMAFKSNLRRMMNLRKKLRRKMNIEGAEVSLKMLLSKRNHDTILQTVKGFFKEFPELEYFMIKLLKSREGVLDESTIDEVEEKLVDYKIVSKTNALQLDLRPTPYYGKFKCWISPLSTIITPTGCVYICCNYHLDKKDKLLGKVTLDNRFRDIWGGSEHKVKISNLKVGNCNKPAYCNCRFFRYQEIIERMLMYHPMDYRQVRPLGGFRNFI